MVKRDDGAVLIEFALVIPMILLIAFGALQLIFLANIKTIMQQAAFDAVRSAAVYPTDQSKAREIVIEQTRLLPMGAGNISKKPEIVFTGSGDEIDIKVKANVELLPLIKQATMVGGGDGSMELAVTATAKREPYLGQKD